MVSLDLNSSVSALSIRQAMAFQRYKETILRAGTRTKALQNAVFGDTSKYIMDEYADFIGAVSAPIDFNSVAATAESENHNVGQLSSNGISTRNGHAFTYHAHDFGIIIGLTYILPTADYESYGIDAMVRKTESSDFYKPAFQNLGLAPVFNFDFNIMGGRIDYKGDLIWNTDSVLGYLARYWEYKTAYDKVHGEFFNSLPFPVTERYSLNPIQSGAFSSYVSGRDAQIFSTMSLKALYVNPADIDAIFYNESDFQQITDKFLFNMNHVVKALLPMSVVGLPQ